MPMHQFTCRTCGQEFDKQLKMAQASEPQSCPSCYSTDTRKIISRVAVGQHSQSNIASKTRPVTSPFT